VCFVRLVVNNKPYFRSVKNRLLFILYLLLLSASALGAEKPGFQHAYLYIKIPSNINTNKYTYQVSAKYVNRGGSPFGISFATIKEPGQIIKGESWGGFSTKYEDTLVDIRFVVIGKRWEDRYVYHEARVKIDADSVFYAIPELPAEEVIDQILHEKGKAYRKEHRGEDFVEFMTDWKSLFIYANFYQGNRPYGELSFSTARYNEVPIFRNLFSRYNNSEPGFIRGWVYGAEFNFLWRRNDFILGPKFGFQIASRFVNLGLSAVYYTNFTHGTLCLKPRIGLNPKIPWVNFSYEYAIRLSPDYFGNRINRHQFSVYFVIPLRLEEY